MKDMIPTLCGNNHLHLPTGCGVPYFYGTEDVSIVQGTDFNPRMNVLAFDEDGNSIPYTVSPSSIDCCDVGVHTLTYTAGDISEVRDVTVLQAPSPTFSGLSVIRVEPNEEFNPLDGVVATDANGNTLTATVEASPFSGLDSANVVQGNDFDLTDGVTAFDANGNSIPFTVSPSEFDECTVGNQVYTYTSARATRTRTITVTRVANPTISGASEGLEVSTGETFDPLDGVSAVDGNGNTVTVTVVLEGE